MDLNKIESGYYYNSLAEKYKVSDGNIDLNKEFADSLIKEVDTIIVFKSTQNESRIGSKNSNVFDFVNRFNKDNNLHRGFESIFNPYKEGEVKYFFKFNIYKNLRNFIFRYEADIVSIDTTLDCACNKCKCEKYPSIKLQWNYPGPNVKTSGKPEHTHHR